MVAADAQARGRPSRRGCAWQAKHAQSLQRRASGFLRRAVFLWKWCSANPGKRMIPSIPCDQRSVQGHRPFRLACQQPSAPDTTSKSTIWGARQRPLSEDCSCMAPRRYWQAQASADSSCFLRSALLAPACVDFFACSPRRRLQRQRGDLWLQRRRR